MKNKSKKNLQVLMVILLVIMIPGLVKIFTSNAFLMVRDVDMALLFGSGMGAGAFLVTLFSYLKS